MSEYLIESSVSNLWLTQEAIRQRKVCGLPVTAIAGRDEDGEWSMVTESKIKTKDGKELHASDFAFVGDPEDLSTWKLPIHDAAHVRNALARLNQTEGIPSSKKAEVLAKIKARAKHFGIDVSDN